MANWLSTLRRVRLVYRPSSKITKAVVSACAVLCLLALLMMQVLLSGTQQKRDTLRAHAAELERINAQLTVYIKDYGSIENVIRIAESQLGLMNPNSIIFQPQN